MAAEADISYSKVKTDNLNKCMVERYYGVSDVIRSHSPIDSYGGSLGMLLQLLLPFCICSLSCSLNVCCLAMSALVSH